MFYPNGRYYDSMGGNGKKYLEALRDYIVEEAWTQSVEYDDRRVDDVYLEAENWTLLNVYSDPSKTMIQDVNINNMIIDQYIILS